VTQIVFSNQKRRVFSFQFSVFSKAVNGGSFPTSLKACTPEN